MGMNWDSSIVIGFVIDKDDLEMPFKKEVLEKFHMEDRFDSRTGKKLASQVMVIDDKAHEEFFFEGESVGDNPDDLTSALENHVHCTIALHGNFCTGEDLVYSVEPQYDSEDDISLKKVGELAKECDRIRKAFKERFGIDLDEAKIHTVMTYA